jgi:signal transduction histidine kinase
MDAVLQYLQYAVTLAFVFLASASLVGWLRNPTRARGYIALALGMLGVVALVGHLNTLVGGTIPYATVVTVVAFQVSGLGLLLLRHTMIPIGRWGWAMALVGLGGTAAAAVYAGTPAPQATPNRLQSLTGVGLIVAWMAAVAEPTIRFWLSSRSLPAVQRRRLQALSLGYLGLVLVLLTAFLPRSTTGTSAVQLATSLAALLIAPLLYAGFSPPQLLRRLWRESEEEPFRDAVHQLLLFSASRGALAERALEWAVRLVGAEFGMILDGDGALLAVRGVTREKAASRASALLGSDNRVLGRSGGLAGSAIVLPLPLDSGTGYLVAEAGPFTPVFGQDEVVRLRQYAAAITAALDRTRVAERVIALEEVKSRFLKLASHELRGPLALVKGYMSMVGEGALSPDELQGVMPMLQGRLEQMSGMLNEMLETARLEDDRLELKPERFDMRQAVRAVTAALEPLAGPQHRFNLSLPDHEVPVLADRSRVETIVTNMVDNAIKYSPRGGGIDCTVEVHGGDALLAVTDHGIGISGDDMGTLFTRFGRITSDATISIPGTGLGLYLSRELARMQHGDLTANSEPGEGSTFVLKLPLARAAGS